jgi:DNA-directed RNA polymerase specialized sigma subunit
VELILDGCVYLINPRAIRYIKYEENNYIVIVMNGSKDERDDINIRINVSNDKDGEFYKEIRNKLFRKFGLREEKTYENVIKLFEKGMETKEIANILRIRMGTVIKIIGKYKKNQ